MLLLAAAASLAASVAPAVPDARAGLEALRAQDARLAAIAYRLVTANRALCRDLAPTPGWALHALGQYADRAAARAVFGFDGPVVVELVVPGAPAAVAGVAADESLATVNAQAFPAAPLPAQPDAAARDAATALVAAQPADAPLAVELVRGGVRRTVVIPASPGCRSQFEVMTDRALGASSDGRIVQVSERFFDGYTDAEIAVVVAHELSHTILRHRARLEAAGVKWGLFSGFGRNARLFRRTEEDADRLAVSLLYNAGYDPAAAAAFWRTHPGVGGGAFAGNTHASPAERAAASAAEAQAIPPGAQRPYLPPVLATRDQPLQ